MERAVGCFVVLPVLLLPLLPLLLGERLPWSGLAMVKVLLLVSGPLYTAFSASLQPSRDRQQSVGAAGDWKMAAAAAAGSLDACLDGLEPDIDACWVKGV